MNWQDIKVSADNTHFLFQGKPIFSKQFIEVLKFHPPGLAPVKDESGSYHINSLGTPLYAERYNRTFGFYCNRASVVLEGKSFHLAETGNKVYLDTFSWTGNYQEDLCAVRDFKNNYFHIDLYGKKIYSASFIYAGDFKDGIACVKTENRKFKHIDILGHFINKKEFLDLGVFHKNYATAKENQGWHHIDKNGDAIYKQRYLAIEPFYNGFALVTQFDNNKTIIDEKGHIILTL